MSTAPIVLFVYNRLDHTRKTIESLRRNVLAEDSDLFIYSDAAKNSAAEPQVIAVRNYLQTVNGFKSVTIQLREINLGVDKNIIQGVTDIVNTYGKIIVLEDDLVTSKYFLQYMNDALNVYKDHTEVACIHGYLLPIAPQLEEVFFIKGADCWGWATWKRAWDLFEVDGSLLLDQIEQLELQDEFDFRGTYPYTKALRDQASGRTDCWDIRWYAAAFLKNKLTLYPGKSLVNNIGHDNSGTNCADTESYEVEVAEHRVNVTAEVLHLDVAYEAFADFFRTLPLQGSLQKSRLSRSFKYVKSFLLNR
jgi:hypothetical protein